MLESIQKSLGVGKIYKHGIDSLDYRVNSLKNIRVVINHFERYPLITKKLADYILFKQAVDMVQQKQHFDNISMICSLFISNRKYSIGFPYTELRRRRLGPSPKKKNFLFGPFKYRT